MVEAQRGLSTPDNSSQGLRAEMNRLSVNSFEIMLPRLSCRDYGVMSVALLNLHESRLNTVGTEFPPACTQR